MYVSTNQIKMTYLLSIDWSDLIHQSPSLSLKSPRNAHTHHIIFSFVKSSKSRNHCIFMKLWHVSVQFHNHVDHHFRNLHLSHACTEFLKVNLISPVFSFYAIYQGAPCILCGFYFGNFHAEFFWCDEGLLSRHARPALQCTGHWLFCWNKAHAFWFRIKTNVEKKSAHLF